ncbi:hypothetical protein [uncultured Cohaesibacter sp.]|uniref:hypothetical protein n=1 Tax=uncultured Cohaesibacter sp. TaxID=1002546 RepID=UPI00292E3200|nr:hypothetical protein [uncultured Cohaesibacter sp.]
MNAKNALRLSQETSEQLAASYFNWETVNEAIMQATSLGKDYVRIFQQVPINLSGTQAARDLTRQLSHLDYQWFWDEAVQGEKYEKRETARFERYCELVIYWKSEWYSGYF